MSKKEPSAQLKPRAGAFDLAATLQSGQAFHWQRHERGWIGSVGDQAVYLVQEEGHTEVEVWPAMASDGVYEYLGLDDDLPAIQNTFPEDDVHFAQAMAFCPGLRLLRQPFWECLASFITSSLKQVAHISQISHTLRQRFGEKRRLNGHDVWIYPTREALAKAGEAELRGCGLGYRAKFLAQTAEALAEGRFDPAPLFEPSISDEQAVAHLCSLPGVGPKIAHCVLLFACQRHGAFPIDVWIERVLLSYYFPKRKNVSSKQLQAFAHKHFGPSRGYAQQFLFHHARLTMKKEKAGR